MRLIGIDEAGRGPILGPMVMAAVAITVEQETELRDLGIQDSKKYGSGRRAKMARLAARPAVQSRCSYKVLTLSVEEINGHVKDGRLDDLERMGALRLLDEIGATEEDRIVCDGEPIFARLSIHWPNLVAENKADAKHVCVSAASILAKVARDEAMDAIVRRYEPEFGKITGNGYVNQGTRRFLEAYEMVHGGLPPEARRPWKWRDQPRAETPDITELLGGS